MFKQESSRMPRAALALLGAILFLVLMQLSLVLYQAFADNGGGPPATKVSVDIESDKVGATAAEFRVDESGAATYSIPLYAVPGTAGVAPKLSLNYSSQGGYGPIGKGWSIGGLSSITRCRATRETGDFIVNGQPTDGSPAPVNFTATDRYCLDGQRLVPATPDSAACPAVGGMIADNLRTEIESFQRVCAYSQSGGNSGVAFFTVDRKDGSTSWYGDRVVSTSQNLTYNGYVNSTAPGKEAFAIAWSQTRFQDSTGNYIDYVYYKPGDVAGEQFIYEVRFTGKVPLAGQTTSLAPYAKLVFDYSIRSTPQQAVGYMAGGKTTQSRRLQFITSCASMACGAADQARQYYMTYAPSVSNSGLETLIGVTECRDSTASVCLPATTFEWSQAKNELLNGVSWAPSTFGSAWRFEGFKLGDIDGDGRQDMVWLKDGPGGGNPCATENIFVSWGVLGPDGRQSFTDTTFGGCTDTEMPQGDDGAWQLFDYNGDGRDDLFILGDPGNGSAWVIHPSQGRVYNAFNTSVNLIATTAFIPATYNYIGKHPQLTDFNGDGQLDVIFSDGINMKAYVTQRDGQGFGWGPGAPLSVVSTLLTAERDCGGETCYLRKVELQSPNGSYQLLDFDGDGRSDLKLNTTYEIPDPSCELGRTGNRGMEMKPEGPLPLPAESTLPPIQCYPTKFRFSFAMKVVAQTATQIQIEPYTDLAGIANWKYADFNGDGLTDTLGSGSSGWQVHYNTGTGFSAATVIGTLPSSNKIFTQDVTGDGRADIEYLNGTSYSMRPALPDGSFGPEQPVPGQGAFACIGAGCDPNTYVNIFSDMDADGAVDYFALQISDNPVFYVSQSAPADRGKPRDVITAIQNGLGARTELAYASLTNAGIHRRDAGSRDGVSWGRGSPVQDFIAPMYVVAKASSSSPQAGYPSAMATLYYRYAGAKVQAGGRGFLGFREISTIDPNQTGGYVVTTTSYRQDFPFIGMPMQTIKRAVGGIYTAPVCLDGVIRNYCYSAPGQSFAPFGGLIFSQSSQILESAPVFDSASQTPLHVRVKDTDERLSDPFTGVLTSSILTNFQYGAYGNVTTTSVDTFTGLDTLVSRITTANQYAFDDPAKWRLGRLSRSTVTHSRPNSPGGSVPDVIRVSDFSYDMSGPATGLLKEERSQPGGTPSEDLRKAYTLDEFGNRNSVTICSSDIPSCTANGLTFRPASRTSVHRYSGSNYDAKGRFPLGTTELFWDGAGAVPKLTQQVISRNIFGDVTEARDVNNVSALAITGSFGRAYYTWAQAQPGVAPGDSVGGVESWTTYRLCTAVDCPGGASFRQKIVTEGAPTQWTYFDVLGRPVMKAAQTFNAGVSGKDVAASCTQYDASGKPVKTSNPFFVAGTGGSDGPTGLANVCMAGRDWNVTMFDLLGRPVMSQLIDKNNVVDTEVRTAYSGLVTTTTGPRVGMQTVQTRNGKGELVLVRDSVNTPMGYYYFADGSMRAVHRDAGRGIVANGFGYDVLGRKTSQSDPDTGYSTYEYNALGELLAQVSNGQRIESEYDARGRVWRKTVKTSTGATESTSTFEHDTAPNGIGQLAREDISGLYVGLPKYGNTLQFNRSYQYDSMGRPASSLTQIDGGTSYPTAVQYDALGRPFKSQDATGNWAKTEYTSRGFAAAICFSDVAETSPACATPWQRTGEIDAWGKVISEVRSSNGQMPITRTYNAVTGRIERICADQPGSGGNCDLVDEGYAWDKAGNLSTQQKEGRYLETFSYDALNRLTSGYVQGQLSYWAQFDAFGNVCAKSQDTAGATRGYTYAGRAGCGLNDAANTSYGMTNGDMAASPHQVLATPGVSFSYDARGNQTFKDAAGTANDRSIRYSLDDKAFEILTGNPASPSLRTRFWYGPDGSRYKREELNGKRTLYVGNVEIVTDGGVTTFKRTIGGFLLQTIVGGVISNQYLFQDQLGSVVRVTDALGARISSMDFVPSGERRNFADPTQYNGTPAALTPRGFTGHEQVDGQNVIHMNGRIYDPQLGRFLQADPLIQSPGDGQSWNAYTYVFNNPLAYTDPTGLWGRKEQQALRIAVAIVISVWTGGAAAPYFAAGASAASVATGMAIVAAGGFAAGVVASNGSLKQGLIGAFTAMAFAGVGTYFNGLRDASGALTAAEMGAKVLAHGITGGVMSVLQDGKFGHGFVAAGLTASTADAIAGIGNNFVETFAAAIVGGSASELTGGKFANGALTAAFSYAFNSAAHPDDNQQAKNAADAFAKEIEILDKAGVLTKLTPELLGLLAGITARSTTSAIAAEQYGSLSAGLAKLTFVSAMADINFYKNSETIPPTGRQYQGSLINWGKVNWAPFDPGFSQPPAQVWRNFIVGASSVRGDR